MKQFLTIFALMSLLALPTSFAQEIDELDDLIIDDSLLGGDLFDDNLLGDDIVIDEAEDLILDDPTPGEEALILEEVVDQVPEESIIEDNLSAEETTHSSALTPSGALPTSAITSFTVLNVSQDNQNAETVSARPGDVLRYELTMTSDTEDVKDYIASIDVSNVLVALDFTDTGLGVLENGKITYPAYTNAAPCIQTFTFFAQVKPSCGDLKNLSVTGEGSATNVGTSCELARSGPGQQLFLMVGITILMISLVLGMSWRRRST